MADMDLEWCFAGCGRKRSSNCHFTIGAEIGISSSSSLYCSANCFQREMYLHENSSNVTGSKLNSASPSLSFTSVDEKPCISPLFLATPAVNSMPELTLSFLNRPTKSTQNGPLKQLKI